MSDIKSRKFLIVKLYFGIGIKFNDFNRLQSLARLLLVNQMLVAFLSYPYQAPGQAAVPVDYTFFTHKTKIKFKGLVPRQSLVSRSKEF